MLYDTTLEGVVRDKHSCLMGLLISYEENEVLWIDIPDQATFSSPFDSNKNSFSRKAVIDSQFQLSVSE